MVVYGEKTVSLDGHLGMQGVTSCVSGDIQVRIDIGGRGDSLATRPKTL